MRFWQFWWQTLVLSTQYNPPQFIEVIMLILAMILLGIWSLTGDLPYLVLCLSYVLGSSTSMLVREAMIPSTRFDITSILAVLLLFISVCIFVDVIVTLLNDFNAGIDAR